MRNKRTDKQILYKPILTEHFLLQKKKNSAEGQELNISLFTICRRSKHDLDTSFNIGKKISSIVHQT